MKAAIMLKTKHAMTFPMVADGSPLLELKDLCTTFVRPGGKVRALDGVSLSLDSGRALGVVGESGSGKTVLSRSIMGLLPARGVLRSGQVILGGTDLVSLSRQQLRGLWGVQVAMVFQDPATALSPVVRVGRQITDGLRFHYGLSRSDATAHAVELLTSVGLPDPVRQMRQYPHELSGGMRQRVMIAIGLACRPKLLLADEPTTALDVTLQAQVLDLLSEAMEEKRLGSMVLVSHDLGVVAARTDDIAVMYAGRVVEKAASKELFANPRMPYTQALIDAIPGRSVRPHSLLAAIPGKPPDLREEISGCAFAPRCSFARDRCWRERPRLVEESPGHSFACWFPIGKGMVAVGRSCREVGQAGISGRNRGVNGVSSDVRIETRSDGKD